MSFAFSRRLLKQAIFIAVLLGMVWLGHFGYSAPWRMADYRLEETVASKI